MHLKKSGKNRAVFAGLALAVVAALSGTGRASAETVLRIGMTAADIRARSASRIRASRATVSPASPCMTA